LVVGQAVEHEGDQLGEVDDGQLAKEVRVHGADVLQEDDLGDSVINTTF
jgi:hypothetical protein